MPALVELAPNVWQLPLLPLHGLNAYLVGDIVVDAGLPSSTKRLLAALAGRSLTAHVLTHAHPDHQGASAALCEARSIPLWCGVRERVATERAAFSASYRGARSGLFQVAERIGGPGHPVERTLHEGDVVAGFAVIETPGHTRGHISLWRESDRVVVLGDVASYRNPLALSPGLRASSRLFSHDPDENRRSLRKIAALRPRLICFGHGPPLADGTRFVEWVNGL